MPSIQASRQSVCEDLSNSPYVPWSHRSAESQIMRGLGLTTPANGPARVVIRGALRTKSRMELLQDGYLSAVVAAAGCTMAKPTPDDGIDWVLTHAVAPSRSTPLVALPSSNVRNITQNSNSGDEEDEEDEDEDEVDLKVQLKSTAKGGPNPQSGFISISLDNSRFKLLARSRPAVHRILVAMILPGNVCDWLKVTHQELRIHHCAYWLNMQGLKPTKGQATSTVHVPTSQVFDDAALCDIMDRIRQGGRP